MFASLQFLFKIGVWPAEQGKFCLTGDYIGIYDDSLDEAKTQAGCQDICLREATCVGIAYSIDIHHNTEQHVCRLCYDVDLADWDRFIFYRRYGKPLSYYNRGLIETNTDIFITNV